VAFRCEIIVEGRISPTLVGEFEELRLQAALRPADTVLSGEVEDQAAVHGLLRRIEALGLALVEFRRQKSSSY
jgi:hypothetical protein